MIKSYFNNGIIGNSGMLGCISDSGELIRLFWPHIDYPQHIEKFNVGIYENEKRGSTRWLDSEGWQHEQHYAGDTNILQTVFNDKSRGIRVTQSDFAAADMDLMVRYYEVVNESEEQLDIGFTVYSSAISTNPQLTGTIYDSSLDALIHYRNNYYISVSSDMEVKQFQLGSNAFGCASEAELSGFDTVGMMQDGALIWEPFKIGPGGKKQFALYICAAHTIKDVKKLIKEAAASDPSEMYNLTASYWEKYLKSAKTVKTGREDIDALYRRTLLVFRLMSDEKTGGLLASPEIDEGFTKCGRYAYCWGRDAAFITSALDKCGLHEAVDSFYRWAAEVQDEDGSWQQRYHMDGNLAPSWGLQIDETGTILWGILKHYEETLDMGFLDLMWHTVSKGADFLVCFMDNDTGIPAPSYDLWEERLGEHAYSAAAVYGGLISAARIAELLGRGGSNARVWQDTAGNIKRAIADNFWKKDWHRFIRSIRTKMNPWGEENTGERVFLKLNSKGVSRDFTKEDWTVDICLLGLSIPFGVFEPGDPMMEGTASVVEQVLTSPVSGGILRYEYDNYIGGNPWVISTLWLALYYLGKNERQKALNYFEWAVKSQTELGLLPEQVDRETGKPAWVIPLTWSHAMFVLVLDGLLKDGSL